MLRKLKDEDSLERNQELSHPCPVIKASSLASHHHECESEREACWSIEAADTKTSGVFDEEEDKWLTNAVVVSINSGDVDRMNHGAASKLLIVPVEACCISFCGRHP